MTADISINGCATRIQATKNLTERAEIYASVARNTENFTKNIPEGSAEAIRTIQTLGLQAKAILEQHPSFGSRVLSLIPNHPQISIFAFSTLSGGALAFANDISPILGASSVAIAYLGGRLLLGRCLNRPASDRERVPSASSSTFSPSSSSAAAAGPSSASALAASRPSKPQLERSTLKQNPKAAAITYQVLTSALLKPSLLLNPSKMPFATWLSEATNLYDIVTHWLHLTNEDPIDLEDIKRTNLLNSEIFLEPKALKPRNDLSILQSEKDLITLLNDFNVQCKDQPIAAIITRPPHSFGIFYDPLNHKFIFFDPQEREGMQQFSKFRSIRQVVQHLISLRPVDEEFADKAEIYSTTRGRYQNPNACEIRILRKKSDLDDQEESQSGNRAKEKPEKRVQLTPDTSDSSSSRSSSSSSSSSPAADPAFVQSMQDDEELARQLAEEESLRRNPKEEDSLQLARKLELAEEEDIVGLYLASAAADPRRDIARIELAQRLAQEEHSTSQSSGAAHSNGQLSDDTAMRDALLSSRSAYDDQAEIRDFIRLQEDNCFIGERPFNKYATIIQYLTTPNLQTLNSASFLDDLQQLLKDGFGITFTDAIFAQILTIQEQENSPAKFDAFNKLIQKGLTTQKDRHHRFQEYVDDYFRRMKVFREYRF